MTERRSLREIDGVFTFMRKFLNFKFHLLKF